FLDKSSDGGVTWGPDNAILTYDLPPINLNGGSDARAKGAAVIRVMPSNPNELYIVYAADPDQTGPDEGDIFLIKSTDGGTNWSSPAQVNDDHTNNDQVMPWMEIKPNGIIDIVWYDRRNDPADLQWDVYFTSSTDGGNSFAVNTQVNTGMYFSPNPWKTFDVWMGEYPGLAVDNNSAYIGYTSSIPDMNGDVIFGQAVNPDLEVDWGDAPHPAYPVKAINDGARHCIDGTSYLGVLCDPEPDALPNNTATGDDLHNQNDEDGVVFPAIMKKGNTDTLKITANSNGVLNAWFDLNDDGDWADTNEHVLTDVNLVAGLNHVILYIPLSATADTSFARFRFATYGGLSYTGSASDGEVEDYQIIIRDTVTISEPSIAENIMVYPSMFRSDISIQGFNSEKSYSIRLMDLNGRVLEKKQVLAAEELNLDLSFLKSGIYLIVIECENRTEIKKLIKYISV
ncbi:MAG: T9SS type A sorting domain-containing protein, partial [Bacteroidales bacterium]|nr:T9SS type A sorting domain-containing protein [Bacteroidales bacterium]